jgi:hypothetical protein
MELYTLLTTKALSHLPADLSPLVHSFVGPTRPDWRTCKRNESGLLRKYAENFHEIYVYCFTEEECEELDTWTLAGQKLMTKKTTERDHWTNQPFPHDDPEQIEDYDTWYPQRLLWIRYGRYYTGQME